MHIEDVRVHRVWPGREGIFTKAPIEHVFVEVIDTDGARGFGECSCWISEPANTIVSATIEALRDVVVGREADNIEAIWNDLFRRFSFVGNRGVISTVISGLDIALWDLKGRRLDRPIYDLLGGAVRDSVLLYGHAQGRTHEVAVESARKGVAEGYTALKHIPFAIGAEPIREIVDAGITPEGVRFAAERMAALREAVGPDVRLMVDMHGRFHPAAALQVIEALEPSDITWFEEPVPPEALTALKQVRAQTRAPLCAGERMFTRWDVLPVLEQGLVNYVMPDVCWTGGITELRKIASLAETFRVPIAPHAAEGPLQLIASAHVMMATTNFFRHEHLSPWLEDKNRCLTAPLDIRDSALHLSDAPGLGVELDMEFVEHHSRTVPAGAR